MNQEKPLVSVVMPAWNAEKTIANAINSILNQTFKDFELIIIDDGSTDNTLRQIAEFKDKRIRFYTQLHEGLVAARNQGNKQARSEIIAIQDADDLSMPDRLEKCLKEIEKGIEVVIHGAYINMWDKQFECIGRKYLSPGNPEDLSSLLKGQSLTGWPVFKKKCWIEKPFRLETQYCYDWMMHLDWILSGFKYKAIDEGLYEYVRHDNSASITFEKDGRRKESIEKLREIVKQEYNETLN